jgi:hypothetical protein
MPETGGDRVPDGTTNSDRTARLRSNGPGCPAELVLASQGIVFVETVCTNLGATRPERGSLTCIPRRVRNDFLRLVSAENCLPESLSTRQLVQVIGQFREPPWINYLLVFDSEFVASGGVDLFGEEQRTVPGDLLPIVSLLSSSNEKRLLYGSFDASFLPAFAVKRRFERFISFDHSTGVEPSRPACLNRRGRSPFRCSDQPRSRDPRFLPGDPSPDSSFDPAHKPDYDELIPGSG